VNNGIVLSVYSFMEVAAFTTQNAVVAIADTSSMAVNARLKWEDENDTAETWNPISDNSEAWTPISDQSETWNEFQIRVKLGLQLPIIAKLGK